VPGALCDAPGDRDAALHPRLNFDELGSAPHGRNLCVHGPPFGLARGAQVLRVDLRAREVAFDEQCGELEHGVGNGAR
jgi:hypothetical protein